MTSPFNTVIDPGPSFCIRAFAWLSSIFAATRQRPRLTDHLPPIPNRTPVGTFNADARAETMLLEIMRAPSEYADAAVLIARATQALRKRGDHVFAEGFVAFALSRMPTDDDGTVSMKNLRERVHDMPTRGSLVPVLLRLEEQSVIALETIPCAAPGSRFIQMDDVRIRLIVVP